MSADKNNTQIPVQDPPVKKAPSRGFMGPVQFGSSSQVNPLKYGNNMNSSKWFNAPAAKVYDHKNLDAWYNEGQNAFEKISASAYNILPRTIFGFLKSAGMAAEWVDSNFISGTHDYTNPFIEKMDEALKATTRDVYRENPDQAFDMGDVAWWSEGASETIASALQFGGYGALVGSGARSLASAAVRMGVKSSLAKAAAQGVTSMALAYTEGALAGADVYKQTFKHQMDVLDADVRSGKITQEQAKERAKSYAGQAAQATVQTNTAINTFLNLTSVAPIFKRSHLDDYFATGAGARKAGESIVDWRSRVAGMTEADNLVRDAYGLSVGRFQGIKGGAIHYGKEAAQEALEELVNEHATQAGMELGKQGENVSLVDTFGQLKNFFKNTMTEDGAVAAFWGAIGGVGNTYVMENIPMHRRHVRDAKGELIPMKDEEGNIVPDKYQTKFYSSRFIENNRKVELFKDSKDSILKDIDFVATKMEEMNKAFKAGDKDGAQKARRELLSAHMLNAVYRGEGKNFENALDQWANLDNKTNLADGMRERISELELAHSEAVEAKDFTKATELVTEMDRLTQETQNLEGKTEAMLAGLAESPEDSSYMEEINNFKNDLKVFDKMFKGVLGSVHGLADEDIEMEAARRIMNNHINAHYLRRDLKNIEKVLEGAEAALIDPTLDDKDLSQFHNRALNHYVHNHTLAKQYLEAYGEIANGNSAEADKWSNVFGLDREDQEGILKELQKQINEKQTAVQEFEAEAKDRMGDKYQNVNEFLEDSYIAASTNQALIKALKTREETKVRLDSLANKLERDLTPKKAIAEVKRAIALAKKETMDQLKEMQSASRKVLVDRIDNVQNYVNRAEHVIETARMEMQHLQELYDKSENPQDREILKKGIATKQMVIDRFSENVITDKHLLADLIAELPIEDGNKMADYITSMAQLVKERAKRMFQRRKKRALSPLVTGEGDIEVDKDEAPAYNFAGMSKEAAEKYAAVLEYIATAPGFKNLKAVFDLDNVLSNYDALRSMLDDVMSKHNLSIDEISHSQLQEIYSRGLNRALDEITEDARYRDIAPIQMKFMETVEKFNPAQERFVRMAWPAYESMGTMPDFNTIMDLREEVNDGLMESDLLVALEEVHKDLLSINKKYDELAESLTEPPVDEEVEEPDAPEPPQPPPTDEDSEDDSDNDDDGDDDPTEPVPSGAPAEEADQDGEGVQSSLFPIDSFLGNLVDDIDPDSYSTREEVLNALTRVESLRKKIQGKKNSKDQAIKNQAQADLDALKGLKSHLKEVLASFPEQESQQPPEEPNELDDYSELSGAATKKISTGRSIAHYHMETVDEIDNGELKKKQTGNLNESANLKTLLPDYLSEGTRVVATVHLEYKGDKYTNYGQGEYTSEQVNENYLDANGKVDPKFYGTIPIELFDENDKSIGYIHTIEWLTDTVGGNGFEKRFRNVAVSEDIRNPEVAANYPSIEELILELETLRSSIIKAQEEGRRPVFAVTEKGGGHLINYTPAGEDVRLSARDLFPDKTLEIIIPTEGEGKGQPFIEVPSAAKGDNMRVPLVTNTLSEDDVRTLTQVFKDYATIYSSGTSNEEARIARDRIAAVKGINGFNLDDSYGLSLFIEENYFMVRPFTVDDLMSDETEDKLLIDVRTASDVGSQGQVYIGSPGLTAVPVPLFNDENELNEEFFAVLENVLPYQQFHAVITSQLGYDKATGKVDERKAKNAANARNSRVNVYGINSNNPMNQVVFDEASGSYIQGNSYENYNDFLLSNSITYYDGRNKVDGQYVYTVNPVVKITPAPIAFEDETEAAEEAGMPDAVIPVETPNEDTVDDFQIEELGDELYSAYSVRPDPVQVRRKLEQLSKEVDAHNGLTVDQAYSSMTDMGLFEVPEDFNPFKACQL